MARIAVPEDEIERLYYQRQRISRRFALLGFFIHRVYHRIDGKFIPIGWSAQANGYGMEIFLDLEL